MIKNSISEKGMFNVIHLKEIIKIDFIIRKDSDYRKNEFRRKKKIKINGIEIFIVSIEDLILSKLVWAKDSHSEIQLKDIRNLIQEKIDLNYIKKWASSLQVKNLLDIVLYEQHK